jgi:LPXTG-motif cell wall-anchored protein
VPNNHSLSAEHRRHDRLLVARFAVGDAALGQDHEAADLVRRCTECAALAADIRAISGSVAKLPAAPRPRDFRLTTEQAANLRGSRLDRWLRTITGSGWATVRPVAAVALSIGMVMSVVGVLPGLGAAAPAPASTFDQQLVAGVPTPEQTTDNRNESDRPVAPGTAVLMPTTGGPAAQPDGAEIAGMSEPPANANINNPYIQPTPAVEPQPGQSSDFQKSLPGTGSSMPGALLLVGLVVTVLALAVLALLYAARRRFYDPLLR